MSKNYEPLRGLCKDCLFKCNRCEEVSFKGTWECKYYIKDIKR